MKNSYFYKSFFTKLEDRVIYDEKKKLEKISIVMPSYNKVDLLNEVSCQF